MASHQGRVFKRCGCRDENSGRALGVRRPKLRRQGGAFNPRHGDWGYQLELPRTSEGKRRQARRTGLESQEQAWEALDHLKALLELAQGEGR